MTQRIILLISWLFLAPPGQTSRCKPQQGVAADPNLSGCNLPRVLHHPLEATTPTLATSPAPPSLAVTLERCLGHSRMMLGTKGDGG